MEWIQSKLDNEQLFPPTTDVPFPRNFVLEVRNPPFLRQSDFIAASNAWRPSSFAGHLLRWCTRLLMLLVIVLNDGRSSKSSSACSVSTPTSTTPTLRRLSTSARRLTSTPASRYVLHSYPYTLCLLRATRPPVVCLTLLPLLLTSALLLLRHRVRPCAEKGGCPLYTVSTPGCPSLTSFLSSCR